MVTRNSEITLISMSMAPISFQMQQNTMKYVGCSEPPHPALGLELVFKRDNVKYLF